VRAKLEEQKFKLLPLEEREGFRRIQNFSCIQFFFTSMDQETLACQTPLPLVWDMGAPFLPILESTKTK